MADGFVKVLESSDPAAKQVDNETVTFGPDTRYRQRVAVPDGADVALGSTADADTASTVVGRLKKLVSLLPTSLSANGALKVEQVVAGPTQPISAASLPLPTNAATETTLAGIKTGTDKIPASPATDRTLATAPFAVRPSDGTAFIDPRDVSDRAAREVGRARLWDGTDEATVLPRGTVPTSADKGLCVVPLNVARPTYQVVTTEITSATTTGVKENLTLWHPSTLAKDVFIIEIGANVRIVQTAGTFAWELQFISAENGTPGGTALTPQQLNRGDAASGLTVRQVVTGAPTVTGQIFQRAAFPLPAAASPFVSYDGFTIFRAKDIDDFSDAIQLRNGQNEGLRITHNVIAALTTAPVFTVYVRYIERA